MKKRKHGYSGIEIRFNASTIVTKLSNEENNIPMYHQFSTLEQISLMSNDIIIGKIVVG